MQNARDVIARYGARCPDETCVDSADGILAALKAAGLVVIPQDDARALPLLYEAFRLIGNHTIQDDAHAPVRI